MGNRWWITKLTAKRRKLNIQKFTTRESTHSTQTKAMLNQQVTHYENDTEGSHPVTESPSHPSQLVNQSLDQPPIIQSVTQYPVTQSAGHPVTQTSHPVTQSPSHPVTQSPSHSHPVTSFVIRHPVPSHSHSVNKSTSHPTVCVIFSTFWVGTVRKLSIAQQKLFLVNACDFGWLTRWLTGRMTW
jgi:hypothetical protein